MANGSELVVKSNLYRKILTVFFLYGVIFFPLWIWGSTIALSGLGGMILFGVLVIAIWIGVLYYRNIKPSFIRISNDEIEFKLKEMKHPKTILISQIRNIEVQLDNIVLTHDEGEDDLDITLFHNYSSRIKLKERIKEIASTLSA